MVTSGYSFLQVDPIMNPHMMCI